jgi:hypothetical protein
VGIALTTGGTVWGQQTTAFERKANAESLQSEVSSRIADCRTRYKEPSESPNNSRELRAQLARLYVSCLKEKRAEHAVSAGAYVQAVQDKYEVELTQATTDATIAAANNDFLGMSWGAGIGFSRTRSSAAIESAQIVNNVVTVTSDARLRSRVFLESHYYFDGWCTRKDDKKVKRGCGPFMAVTTSNNDVAGVGFGFMFGWKPKEEQKEGFSVGIGLILDNKVKNLASGFSPGAAPPAGATTVLTEEKARWSNMFFLTRTF